MAEMYKELHEENQYELVVTQDRTTGRRTFQRNDNATGAIAAASLPVVGTGLMVDLAGADIANCLCREKRAVFVGGDGNTPGYEFLYSTEPSGSRTTSNNAPKDLAAEDFELSHEEEVIQAYPSGTLNVFEFDGAANDDVKWANQGIPRKLFAGSMSIPYWDQELDEEGRDDFIDLVKTKASCINLGAFRGFAEGQVRFEGVSGGAYRNKDGNVRYAFTCEFRFKVLGTDLAGGAISSDDWLYVINEQEGVYRKVKKHGAGGEYLYTKADFAPLITEPETP